jgi:uncharacterized protein (DUF983 family)
MFGRMKLALAIYLLVAVGGMVTVGFKWNPQGDLQTALWWIAEVVLGLLALQALVGLIFTGGIQKEFKRLDF